MGISITAYSRLTGPVDEFSATPEGHRMIWDSRGESYLVQCHPELADVSWSYGNFVRAWSELIVRYPGWEVLELMRTEDITLPHEVQLISEYLSTVEPLPEHGEDFAARLRQLGELFASAALLPDGVVFVR